MTSDALGDGLEATEAAGGCPKAYSVELKQGRIYWWCRCGKSRRMPFCDNAHKDTSLLPEVVQAQQTGTFLWCGCGKTGSQPECDGCSGTNRELCHV